MKPNAFHFEDGNKKFSHVRLNIFGTPQQTQYCPHRQMTTLAVTMTKFIEGACSPAAVFSGENFPNSGSQALICLSLLPLIEILKMKMKFSIA